MGAGAKESGIREWLCGGCGERHGWICPYFGSPADHHTAEEIKAIKKRMREDRRAK